MEPTEEVGTVQGQCCFVSWNSKSTQYSMIETINQTNLNSSGEMFHSLEFTLSSGICLLKTCSAAQILDFVNLYLLQVNLKAVGASCQTKARLLLDNVDFAAMFVTEIYYVNIWIISPNLTKTVFHYSSMLSTVCILLIASTSYDMILMKEGIRTSFWQPFLYSQMEETFQSQPQATFSPSIDCLEGMRCISLRCIVFSHDTFFKPKRHQKIWLKTSKCSNITGAFLLLGQ